MYRSIVSGTVIQMDVWMEENSKMAMILLRISGICFFKMKSSSRKSTKTMKNRTSKSAAARARR